MQFNELNLSEELLKAVENLGFSEMTEIQQKSIPLLLEGEDVVGRSNTGTGKTAAFGIPAVESIDPANARNVQVLILCPTRELAMQAAEEIKKFAKFMPWVKPCAVYGGASMDKQIGELKRGANIVIGTPGRVMDHMRRRTLKLSELQTIILDEADEMLNMGFREDIESILSDIPNEHQTVLFSATMPPEIMNITKQYQNDPKIVKIASAGRTVDAIEQYYFEVAMGRKTDALKLLLTAYEPKASMVFCNTKKMVDELTDALCAGGFKAGGLHGDMKQAQRTHVMDKFKSGRISVLIATDVAARGIDVSGIDTVFNYDLPQDNEYYIHRIGRTGRAGKTGTAYTLISGRKQYFDLRAISKYIKADIVQKPLPSRAEIIEKKTADLGNKILEWSAMEKRQQAYELLSKLTEQGISAEEIAVTLMSRRLSKQLKDIPEFDTPPVYKGRNGSDKAKIVISVGRMHRIAPNFILGALVDATGMPGKSFGKIDIFDKITTVEVSDSDKEYIVESMNNGKINGNRVTVRLYDGRRDSPFKDRGSSQRKHGGDHRKSFPKDKPYTRNRNKRYS